MKSRWVFHTHTSRLPSWAFSLLSPFKIHENPSSQTSTFVLNHVAISRLLPHCGRQGYLHLGSSIHASLIKQHNFLGSEKEDIICNALVVWNSLLYLYSQCGDFSNVVKLFDDMPLKDTVSWNTIISWLLRNGQFGNGFGCFKRMREMGFCRVDKATMTTLLSALDGPEFGYFNRMIHGLVFQCGYDQETTVGNSLITSYFKCGCSSSGRQVFNELLERNVVTWTAMISGLAQNELYRESLEFFMLMRGGTVYPNSLTYLSLLMACSGLQALSEGHQIHALLWKMGIESEFHIESALMDMYSKCGSMDDAWRIFESAKELDEVAMTVILVGFSQNGFEEEAIQIFKKMVKAGIKIDPNMVSAALGVFGNDTSLGLGKQIHALIVKRNFSYNPYVNNGLINMYSKCGQLEESVRVFNEMPQKNSISWNSTIAAFARHGDGFGALRLYEEMKLEGVKPTDVTFLSLLHACSHVGLVEKGMEFLYSMSKDHGMGPRTEHYACVVDMLGRAGLLTEAKDFIEKLPGKPGPLVWQALLGACSFHSDSEMGKFAAEQLVAVAPGSPSPYVLLANIYSSEGKWKERARTIKRMKEMGVAKETGISWIEVDKKVHSFVVWDRMHPQSEMIYGVLAQLFKLMIDEGYARDKRFILLYLDQDGNI